MTEIKRHYFTFNDKPSKDYSLFITAPGIYNAPSMDVESKSVPGLNGDIIRDNAVSGMHRFSNIDIKYSAFIFNNLNTNTSDIKSWLMSPIGYQKLTDTYDEDFYRMAICTSAISFDVTRHKAATMDITFNCKPQRYSIEGDEAITIDTSGTIITNPFEFYAYPLIRVYGYGESSITIGGRSVTIYMFTEYVDLNCETQNAYNETGFCNETILSDDFPILAPGDNEIILDGAINYIEITPRWWTL